jgi:hypothetical protein
MKRTLLPLLIAGSLMGANPELYSGLGDTIYDAVPKVSELSEIDALGEYRDRIETYIKQCAAAKREGLALDDSAKEKAATQAYLDTLRGLNREYESYIHVAETALEGSVRKNDYATFAALVGTGLIDVEKHDKMVLGFYKKHGMTPRIEEIDAYIAYLDEIKAMKAQQRAKRRAQYEAYKKRRIEQIRSRQEAKEEARREQIDEEARQIKEEVKRTQQQELRQTR